MRVNVQLINAMTDAHLWAETYDRKLTDIFAVESEIAKTIADTLHAKLSGSEERAVASRPTENAESYQLYLQGRFFWNKRTAADLKKSIEYLTRRSKRTRSMPWPMPPPHRRGSCFRPITAARRWIAFLKPKPPRRKL